MSGALALGWRNIWRNRRRTLLSMSAIGVGLLLVIFYSGMVGGMLGDAKNQLDDAGLGHVEVVARGFRPRGDVSAVMREVSLGPLPAGAEAGARVLSRGLATSARGNEPIRLLGVDWNDEVRLSAHLRHLTAGALPADARGVVVGEQLAERLGLEVGSELRLMVQRADHEMRSEAFIVRGIFHSIAAPIGQRQVYVARPTAAEVAGVPGATHQFVIQLDDPAQAPEVASALRARLGAGYEVETWAQLLPILERMDRLTNHVVFALAAFVYLLVGLGVLNTMLMSVLERTREFGVLMALGTRPSRVLKVVLAESFWIATVSVLFGAALGALLTWYFARVGVQVSSATESYTIEGATISTLVKTRFQLADVVKASSFVYLMALVVGLYPASRILRLRPAEALRRT